MTRYIADRKNAKVALHKSEEGYRLVMEACPEPIVVYGMQGRAQYLNLVITDMTMPDLTGTALATKILAMKADMPIIMCTGLDKQVSKVKV